MSIEVNAPGGYAGPLGLALAQLVLPVNSPVMPGDSDSPDGAPQLAVGLTYVLQGPANYGAILLPSAVTGSIVVLLNANDAGNFVSVLTQEGDTLNTQYDQIDWNPLENYNDMPAPLIFYSPSNGSWWTNGQLD